MPGRADAAAGDLRPTVRLARRRDLSAIADLLTDGARRMVGLEEGNPWPIPFPKEEVLPLLRAGHVYVGELPQGGVVGTFTLIWEDPAYWPSPADQAGYFHRLAVRSPMRGHGIGRRMIDEAGAIVVDRGRRWIRLNCLTSAIRLRSYYESMGFRPAGRTMLRGFDLSLYERELFPPESSRGKAGPANVDAPD